ncbi:Hypothetical protein BN2458_PEG1758 [Helicobacter typhlonius]|uniref:Uncharacterized protein n=1 Tax=Helicobacter typhlonius TaxID=76936 RepID=A0A0S4PX81_9HELI|nr:Hypothetical protein BN2458_PEG1758 [Helicobacter typhlonius]
MPQRYKPLGLRTKRCAHNLVAIQIKHQSQWFVCLALLN